MKNEFEALLESAKYAPLDETQKNTLAAVMENTTKETERMINEGTISSDIAQFTPFLMPMLRKVYPALIANELLGVQPLAGPTGFIYSLTNRYLGNAASGLTGKPGNDLGGTGPSEYDKTNAATQVLLLSGTNAPTIGDKINDGTNDIATVVYFEPASHGPNTLNSPALEIPNTIGGVTVGAQKPELWGVLVQLEQNGYFVNGGTGKVKPGDTWNDDAGTGKGTVSMAFTGLAAFDKILPNFSGSYTTSTGEVVGTVGNEMNEVGIAVERTQVEAKTRKLRAEYTIEMYQDLKAMHGVLADQELMNLMSYEIKAETDREIVDFVNSRAKLKGDFYLNGTSGTLNPTDFYNAGRWEIERYRNLGIKLADESREIGRRNKRGAANKLLVSPKVLTVLEAIGGFTVAPIASTVNANSLNPVAGRFDNKFNVVVDNYADQGEYATLLYKGSNQDSLGVYAPYTPVQIQKVTHVTTGQPALIAMSRYGLGENPWGGYMYSTTFGVDFSDTVLTA